MNQIRSGIALFALVITASGLSAVEPPPLLAAALATQRKASGNWAFTMVTTVILKEKGIRQVAVETYDPGQPPEKAWTLVSWDGRLPAAGDRAFIDENNKLTQNNNKLVMTLLSNFAFDNFSQVSAATANDNTLFIFHPDVIQKGVLLKLPQFQPTFWVNRASGLLVRMEYRLLKPWSFALLIAFKRLEFVEDYATVLPEDPPLLVGQEYDIRCRALGLDTGDLHIERQFRDYRKVRSYDARFKVAIGDFKVIEYMPGAPTANH